MIPRRYLQVPSIANSDDRTCEVLLPGWKECKLSSSEQESLIRRYKHFDDDDDARLSKCQKEKLAALAWLATGGGLCFDRNEMILRPGFQHALKGSPGLVVVREKNGKISDKLVACCRGNSIVIEALKSGLSLDEAFDVCKCSARLLSPSECSVAPKRLQFAQAVTLVCISIVTIGLACRARSALKRSKSSSPSPF